MKTTTILSTIVLSLISLNALADCEISVGRYQQQQQQQAQARSFRSTEPSIAIEDTARYTQVDLDQCYDLYRSTMNTLLARGESSANRVLLLSFDFRGIKLTYRQDLIQQQQQQQPQQQVGQMQQLPNQ